MKGKPQTFEFKPDRAALVDKNTYNAWYAESISDPDGFWSKKASQFIEWFHPWDEVTSGSPSDEEGVQWFSGGKLNVSYNCIDRHVLAGHGNDVAILHEGNAGESKSITYAELLVEVSRLGNVLRKRGVKKGDRVCIYMPMVPEAMYAMLACARVGAVHSVVFAGFSSDALAARIIDAECNFVITADIGMRGDKVIPLKERVNEALARCPHVKYTLVLKTSDARVPAHDTDLDYRSEVSEVSTECEPEVMDSEAPLFILYTSGSTGKPKGVVHTTAGYLLYAALSHSCAFDYRPGDVYWCMADVGWITGHTYAVYGPLSNRATCVMFEGVPTYPGPSRTWEIVEKYKVSVLYSMPTLLRSLRRFGDQHVHHNRKSLRILGSVGEPIDPETWHWFFQVVGEGRCPIVDTWWQTETGGFALLPLPYAGPQKPGYCMRPFFGIQPLILDEKGNEIKGTGAGSLVLKGTWPSMMRTLWKDRDRFVDTYFKPFKGYYTTGDGAERDEDGNFRVTGRVDDAINVSGHLIGTAEIESVLTEHPSIVEAAVIGIPHAIKGEAIYAFVILAQNINETQELSEELNSLVCLRIGAFAKPDTVSIVSGLPKTRSGKIMRRVLRKIVTYQSDDLGDLSTLADQEPIEALLQQFKK